PAPDEGAAVEPEKTVDAIAQAFLDHLGLPLVHPLCGDVSEGTVAAAVDDDAPAAAPAADAEDVSLVGRGVFELPNATLNFHADDPASQLALNRQPLPPPIGSISLLELHDNSVYELLVTATTMSAPTMAMAELWLRFFAVFLAPLCLAWLLHREINATGKNVNANVDGKTIVVCVVGLASSAVLFTDSLYVYEYGRGLGFSTFVLSNFLAIRCALAMNKQKERKAGGSAKGHEEPKAKALFQSAIAIFIVATGVIFLRSDGGHALEAAMRRCLPALPMNSPTDTKHAAAKREESYNPLDHMSNPGIDLPTIDPGLYYSSSNAFISSIVSHWPESGRTYSVQNGATPYLVNGDQRTGIPFLVNKVEDQEYVRVWTRNRFDGEYLALDIAFPYNGDTLFTHDLDMPVYLVLHGLNGGSHEEYVKDLVKRRRSEGSTVVVMIARGMMDTEMVGWNAFHGARTGDVDIAARELRRGLKSLAEGNQKQRSQMLTGVGYSMGGGLDMRQQLNFRRSMRLWQPMLTFNLREDIIIGKYARHYKSRLTEGQFLRLLRVTSISALDVEAIVTYNSFSDMVHYYTEMSAMGDRDPEFQLFSGTDADSPVNDPSWGRIANVSVPFAVLQSLDDPLIGWRTIGTEHPQGLVDSGNGNVMLLLTKAGGHVGWPLGSNPKKHAWKWMSNAVRDFALAVNMARKESNE
ncbi:hypothetical protein ACHAWF_007167, partial [Thalassiosira exigua]